MRNVLKRALSCLLAFVMVFSLMPQLATPVYAAGPYEEEINVSSLLAREKIISVSGTYRLYGTYTASWTGDSRYITVADGVTAIFDMDGVSLTSSVSPIRILGTGKVEMNLIGDNTLKCFGSSASYGVYQSGITVSPNAELIINGTDSDTLTASAGHFSAAIGGYYAATNEDSYSGKITINGGVITATGGMGNYGAYGGAGIGGGGFGGNGGGITINGGTVIATASYSAAIGGGHYGDGGNITINSGTVIATAITNSAAIGGGRGGSGGNITINGGTITATGGSSSAGIGGGNGGNGGNITITAGNVTSIGGSLAAGIGGGWKGDGGNITITDGVVTATGGIGGAGIGGGWSGDGGNVDITGGIVKATADYTGIGGGGDASGGYNTGINVFTSGNIETRNTNGTITVVKATDTTNGAANGTLQVNCIAVTVRDIDNNLVPNATVTIEDNLNGNYTYTAVTNSSGVAYCWVPPRSGVTIEAEHEELGFGYAEGKTVQANNTNAVTVVLGMRATVTKTPSERALKANADSTPVTLNVRAENLTGVGDIIGVEWFRVSITDSAVYKKSNFAAGYDAAATGNKGNMAEPAGGTITLKNYSVPVGKNGTYWVRVEFKNGLGITCYHVKSIVIDNIYDRVTIGVRGTVYGTFPVRYLYGSANAYEPLVNDYGIPYDLDGTTALESPSLGFYRAVIDSKQEYKYYWNSTVKGTSTPITLTLDRDFTTNPYCDGDPSQYTLTYVKNLANWMDVNIKFVKNDGSPISVNGNSVDTVSVPVDSSGNCVEFLPAGAWYDPPSDNDYSPIGYMAGTSFDAGGIELCSDFSQFDPVIYGVSSSTIIYIVYEQGLITATEHYQTEDGAISWSSTTTVIDPTDGKDYDKAPKTIQGYVPVGYKIEGLIIEDLDIPGMTEIDDTTGKWMFDYGDYKNVMLPDESQADKVFVHIPNDQLSGDFTVTFYYAAEAGTGTGIPESDAARIDVSWVGTYVSGKDTTLQQKAVYTRKNYALSITNDDTASGNPAHTIAAAAPSQWIFDDTRPEASGNEKRTVTPTGDMGISFFYDFDTLGEGVPDKNQYVTEKYIFEDDGSDLRPSNNYHVLKGGSYSRSAPVIDGYVAYAYTVDGGGLVEFDRGQPKTVSFITTDYTHEVVFVYKTAAAPVTVNWLGTTYGGIPVNLGSMLINGYLGEEVMVLPGDSPVAIDSGWKLDKAASDVPDTIVLDGQVHTYTYYYNENALFATVTVEGSSTDNKIYYGYEQTKRLDEGTFTVTAWSLPNYRVTGYSVYDAYNNLLDSGTGSSVKIDLSKGSQKVSFTYVCTITTVVIRAVNAADHDEVLFTQTITDAIIGEQYSAVAPYIDNTWVLAGDVLQVKTVQEGTNIITFEYDKATGNVTVLLKEDDTDGRIIKVMSETVVQGSSLAIAIPDLGSYYYTAISSAPDTVDYSGSNPVPAIIEYYYKKQMMDVQIKAIDKADGTVLKTFDYPQAARMGEMYKAVAPPVGHYTVAEENYKNAYADPSAGTLVVEFEYAADELGNITVRYYYLDASNQEVVLSEYTGNAIVGSKFTAAASLFDGFTLDDESEKEITVSDDDHENIIKFKYIDERLTVTTKTKLGSNEATVYGTPEKVSLGTTMTVTAPHMNGYVVKGYWINDKSEVTTGTLISVPLTVAADTTVTFMYVRVEDVLEEYTSAITVQGVEDSTTHYEYTLTMAQNADSFDVKANSLTGLKVTGYTVYDKDDIAIGSGTSGTVNVDPADGSQTVVFTYASNMTTVTIRALYSGTTSTSVETFTPMVVPAEVGKQFSYAAPSITGFTYVSASPAGGMISSVPDDGTGEIIFYYTKDTASGGLIIKAVDQDGGAELATVYRSISKDGTFTPSAANDPKSVENPAALANYELVSFAPTGSSTYDGVHDITVTYTYKKIERDVIVEAWDANTFTKIGEMSSVAKDVGAAYTMSAPTSAEIPELANYTLLNDSTQSVYVDNSSTNAVKITFYYRPNSPGSIKVIAYWMDGEVEREIQSNATTHAAGIPVTVTAPTLHGWTLVAEAPFNTSTRTVTPTASATIEVKFRYVKDVSTVTIKLVSGMTDITSQVSAGYATSIEVPKGDAYTVYAPYINGYVLADNEASVKEVTSAQTGAGDVEVTFTYKTVEEAVNEKYVDITIKGVSGATELYSYVKRVAKGDTEITLIDGADVFVIPGYVLDANQAHNVVPDMDRTMTFNYTSTAGTVKISLVDDATGKPVGAGSFNVSAEIGSPFTYLAPNVDGYRLVSVSSIGKVASVAVDGSSEIAFRYAKIQSKVTVVYKEDDTNGKIIRVVEVADPVVGTPTSVATPDLTNEYYTAKQASVTYSFNGTDAVEVEAYYEKVLIDIVVVAIDDATSLELDRDTLTGQKKGEVISVTALTVTDYAVIGASAKLVVADGADVEFRYRNTSDSGVTVQIYSGSQTGEMLQSYKIPATTGDTVTVNPDTEISIAGYTYNSSHADNKLSATAEEDAVIIVIMTDNRLTLTVSNNINSDIITEKVVSGSERVVYPPYIEGYIAASYQINGGAVQTIGTSFTGVDLTGANKIMADTEIVFNYKIYEDVVNEKYVDITIKGVSGAVTLYSYTMRVLASNTAITLTQPEEVFEVPGHVLSPGQDAKFSVTPDADKTVTFNYDTLSTMVRIRMVDADSGQDVAASFAVAATTGGAFSYTAPHVPGYYPTSTSSIGTINPVLANGASELTFTYKPITSKVTIVCKDGDTNGAIIKIIEVTSPKIGTADYNVPNLAADYYTANAATVGITYDGINTVSVEAYYTKELIDIPLNAVNYRTNAPLTAVPDKLENQRRGEVVSVGAPGVAGYVLVSATPVMAIADGSAVTFKYRTQAADEVQVIAKTSGGTVLQSYVVTGTVGETVNVNPPSLLGWKTSDSAKSAVIGTDPEIVFTYTKDVVTVTVKAVDSSNNTLSSTGVEVARGGSYTVYAPHIPGYVVYGDSSKSFTNLVADDEAVFTYKTVDDASDENYVIITIQGVSGTTELYSYTLRIKESDTAYTLPDAFTVPGYAVTTTPNPGVVIPNKDRTFTYEYVDNMTVVTIQAVYEGTSTPVEGFTEFTVPAEKGSEFTYAAPSIAGTANTGNSMTGGKITVASDGSSVITFYYKKTSGNLTVIAMEGTTEIGRYVRTVSQGTVDKTDAQAPTTTEIPALAGYTLVTGSGASDPASYDGVTDVTLTYSYTRDRVSIKLVAYDSLTGSPIDGQPAVTVTDVRVLENYDYSSKFATIAGYTYVPTGSTTIVVPTTDGTEYKVFYRPQSGIQIPVEIRVGSASGKLLQSYTIGAYTNESVSVAVPTLAGYVHDSLHPDNRLTTTAGSNETLMVIMTDVRATVDVTIQYLNKATGSEIKSEIISGQAVADTFTFSPPSAFNHGGRKYERDSSTPATVSITVESAGNVVTVYYNDKGAEDGVTIELIKDNHIVYINGRGGGRVSPDSNMTRAEVAQMFYNLLVDKTKGAINVSFSDVQTDGWYYTAITVLASKGVINGYPDGTYKPDGNITRAEFAAIASRFDSLMDGRVFSDVSTDHWAYRYIANASAHGWVQGYPDGTFKPDQNITRAEVIKITNAALGRVADKSYIDSAEGINKFTDLDKSHWAYYEIIEATNAHNFSMDNGSEIWTDH